MRGQGRAMFVAILLIIVGVLNIIYGIGALGDARVMVNDTRLVFDNLNTYGWVLIILGTIQLIVAFSLAGGATFGLDIGIEAVGLGAINSLLSVGGNYPWWSLAIFFLCVYIVHGIFIYGEEDRALGA